MIKYSIARYFIPFLLLFFTFSVCAQVEQENYEIIFYKKKELNAGLLFSGNSEREEFRTDLSKSYEEITSGAAAFQFKNSFWNYLDYKQDFLEFNFELGPFYGFGSQTDSSNVESIEADQTQIGVRGNLSAIYSSRYYYNTKNYTLVEVRGWAGYNLFKQNSEGSLIDSNEVVTNFDKSSGESKLRYGFEAKAGWGWGRLNAMNNYMLAQFILEKYYSGRLFSEKEIRQVAKEISIIKEQRDIVNGHNNEIESKIVSDFLNEKMLLTEPEDLAADWEFAEFKPRVDGIRIEFGPFFNYFNREPDFIYGTYIQYENAKYSSLKWNRNFSAGINYNRYKQQDWVLAELNMGWSYFPDLKRQFDFGVKYVPGLELNDLSELGEFNHGLVPYVGYFSQINSKSRVNLTFAYRISPNDKVMFSGPEFSLSIYRSRY
ncbi:MAG: hypothetical protein HQ522_02220 [Bacteroidetes bacterium]|nr:hypothetical protein [Bacteroidota bacterium]